jgi:ribonuclease VapC
VPPNIRSEAVNQLAEAPAARMATNKTEAVARALRNELQRLDDATPLRIRLRPIQNRILSRPATGLDADKQFYDAQRRSVMFVDTSAIVAILTREPDAGDLIDRLEQATRPITSAIAVFEATLGICRKRHTSVAEAQVDLDFLKVARVELVSIAADEASLALAAFARYGKGRGHPAQLNMGDCFAYAVARRHQTELLFQGDDFSQTDIVQTDRP